MANSTASTEQGSDLKQVFLSHLPQRIVTIEEGWNGLTGGVWNRNNATRLFLRLQDMSGTTGKFGLIRVSEILLALERNIRTFIVNGKAPAAEEIEQVNGLIRELKETARDGSAPNGDADLRPEKKKPRIFCLCPSETLAPRLGNALEAVYCSVVGFKQVEKLLEAYEEEAPAAIVVEGRMLPMIDLLGKKLKRDKQQQGRAPSLAVISSSSALDTRLSAMHAGAEAYFVTPIDAGAVAARVKQLIGRKPAESYRIMVVEDDPSQADFAAAILRKADMQICTVTEPAQVLTTLETFRPDLILMDLHMPHADGMQLTSIIREQHEFISVPIIFLSGEQDTDKQMDALGAGADDFLAKPIRPRHLVAMVKNRVQRTRALRAQVSSESHRDPVTGLFNRRRFLESVDNELAANAPHPNARAVLIAELDHAEEIQKQVGGSQLYALLAEIGSLIALQIEPQDVAARLDEHHFAVMTKRPLDKDILTLAEGLLKAVAGTRFEGESLQTQPTLSLGVCFFNSAPLDTAGLVGRANQTCRLARSRGGNRIEHYRAEVAPKAEAVSGGRETVDLIKEALGQNSFQVLFQPFANLRDRKSENYQMMLRLRSDTGEPIPAKEFMPEARRAGLAREVDRWLIDRALEIMDEHRRVGGKVGLMLGLSAETLADTEHAQWLRGQLRSRLLVGTGLILEFNLVDTVNDLKGARVLIAHLQQMGVGVCLARFGHNDSSYKILQYMGARYVKVVEKLLEANTGIITSMIRRVHQLGARVIVPQVENPKRIGSQWLSVADFVQGDAIQQPKDKEADASGPKHG